MKKLKKIGANRLKMQETRRKTQENQRHLIESVRKHEKLPKIHNLVLPAPPLGTPLDFPILTPINLNAKY